MINHNTQKMSDFLKYTLAIDHSEISITVTCCHYGRICLSRERLAQAAVTSETDRPTDLKEAKFTEFVSSLH